MTALVIGTSENLGKCFVRELRRRGHEVIDGRSIYDRSEDDIRIYIRKYGPSVVFYCRGLSDTNTDNVDRLTTVCSALGVTFFYISNSMVFNLHGAVSEGSLRMPESKTGLVLFRSENIVRDKCKKYYIVRYPDIIFGQSGEFDILDRLVERAYKQQEFTFDDSGRFSVVFSDDAAEIGVDIAECGKFGVYHCANEGTCSMFGFSCEVFRLLRLNGHDRFCSVTVHSADSQRQDGIIYKCENIRKAGIEPLESWSSSLARCIASYGKK